jgi:hypothetical protein
LGCNAEGFAAYQGDPDMLRVHKFMNLNEVQVDFFNTQVALAAAALGVEEDDVATIGLVLDTLFNARCTPPLTIESGVPDFLIGTQSGICLASSCPVADSAACINSNNGLPTEAPSALSGTDLSGSFRMWSVRSVGATIGMVCVGAILAW